MEKWLWSFLLKALHVMVAPRKGIEDSLGLDSTPWIPDSRYWIPNSLSVELGYRIPIVSGIPDSFSCIPDSKTQDSNSTTKNFPDSRIRIPYFHGGDHGIEKLQQLKLLRWSFESQIDNLDFHAPCRPIKVNFNLYNFGINDKWKWNEVTKVDLDVLD